MWEQTRQRNEKDGEGVCIGFSRLVCLQCSHVVNIKYSLVFLCLEINMISCYIVYVLSISRWSSQTTGGLHISLQQSSRRLHIRLYILTKPLLINNLPIHHCEQCVASLNPLKDLFKMSEIKQPCACSPSIYCIIYLRHYSVCALNFRAVDFCQDSNSNLLSVTSLQR